MSLGHLHIFSVTAVPSIDSSDRTDRRTAHIVLVLARLTCAARNEIISVNAVAYLEILNVRTYGFDDTRPFVTKAARIFDLARANEAAVSRV